MKALGQHILVEFYGCPEEVMKDNHLIEKVMNEAAEASGATIVGSHFHTFNPYGVSGVIVIAESHFTVHTWPEYGYAAIDIFTCGETIDNLLAFDYMKQHLKPQNTSTIEMKRGQLQDMFDKNYRQQVSNQSNSDDKLSIETA
ncbi:adenosylmethionine decarboxylase [uncultured Microscilla sp.]|uniref:adenosylmethionine decarboxylase n=1 Tax=uncultured Microscilla sp. TaxID=432653 RepID=UPI0026075FB8|nr:adenosylmethionine decarboxylase [uncultured Microscilla sp.]